MTLGPSHGVAGSRTRFTEGRIELRLDDAWRSRLAQGPRRVVTAVTLPQLVGYGYVGLRRAPPGSLMTLVGRRAVDPPS